MATNTTKSVFKDSKASDAELSAKAMQENKVLASKKRVPFKCEVAYNALYPNGFESSCQGIPIYLIFDGRTVELPEFMIKFFEDKANKKALSIVDKNVRYAKKSQEYLGMEIV